MPTWYNTQYKEPRYRGSNTARFIVICLAIAGAAVLALVLFGGDPGINA